MSGTGPIFSLRVSPTHYVACHDLALGMALLPSARSDEGFKSVQLDALCFHKYLGVQVTATCGTGL